MEPHEPTDSQLVCSVLAGDREAFGLLYDRFARLVRAVVCEVSPDPHTVHDLTQECFLRAYRNLAKLEQPARFRYWLLGIARQVVRERRRSRRRDRHKFVDGHELEVADESDTPGASQTREEIQVVLRHLAELPERERLAIHAFFLEERQAPQAAALLGLSRSGLYAVLARGLARLAARLQCPTAKKEVK